MKRLILFIVVLVFCVISVYSQTVLTPHFTESSKKIVIPKESKVNPGIHGGLIQIASYPNVLYVDTLGVYLFGSNFPVAASRRGTGYFSGGAAMLWRTVDGSGVPCILYADGTYRDVPAVKPKTAFGGYSVMSASDFMDGYAVVTKGSAMGYRQTFIDGTGKEVFPLLSSEGSGTFGDGEIYPLREDRRVYYDAKLKKYGYADGKGNVVIKPQFDKAQSFSEGYAAVSREENYAQKWGFINMSGTLVIPATYSLKPGRFSEGLAAVRIGGSEYDFEMAYIDTTGKRVIENKKWNLNEFHDGYAWVGTGCNKLFVWNKQFEEVRDITKDFAYNGNGNGTCNFSMTSGKVTDPDWGFDFPGGTQCLFQSGVAAGDIFAPDGTIVYHADIPKDDVLLNNLTEGGLMFCKVRLDDPRLSKPGVTQCFINKVGEIVFYFQESVEGFEGPVPVEAKAIAAPAAKTPAAKK